MSNTIETQKQTPNGHWRILKYNFDRGADMARYVARERYSFPGAYELFAVADDGGILCSDCCRTEYWQIAHSSGRDGWSVSAIESDAMLEESIYCDHCSKVIGPETD